MKIREIVTGDFRRCEKTLFEEYCKFNRIHMLRPGEVIVFLSQKQDQLLFVYGWTSVEDPDFVANRLVLRSARHRLMHGTWNPLMLRNYANAAGLAIEGLRRFEDFYKDLH